MCHFCTCVGVKEWKKKTTTFCYKLKGKKAGESYLTLLTWEFVREKEEVIISSSELGSGWDSWNALRGLLQQIASLASQSGESVVANRHPLGQTQLIIIISKEWILESACDPPGNLFESVAQKIIKSNHPSTKQLGGSSEGKSLIISVIRRAARAHNHRPPGEFLCLCHHVMNLVLPNKNSRNLGISYMFVPFSLSVSTLASFLIVLVLPTLLYLFWCGTFWFPQNPQPQTLLQRRHHRAAAAPLKLQTHPVNRPHHPAQGHQRKRHKETESWRCPQRVRQKKRKLYVFFTAPSARWLSTRPPSCRLTPAVRGCSCRRANPVCTVSDPSADPLTLYLLRHQAQDHARGTEWWRSHQVLP